MLERELLKKTFSLMLSLCLAGTVNFTVTDTGNDSRSTVIYADMEKSGKCGDDARWVLEDDTLVISGTGKLDPFYGRSTNLSSE